MEILLLIIFLLSLGIIVYQKINKKEVKAQFIVTGGIIMIIFYIVCFLSGICTILNFIWRWIL